MQSSGAFLPKRLQPGPVHPAGAGSFHKDYSAGSQWREPNGLFIASRYLAERTHWRGLETRDFSHVYAREIIHGSALFGKGKCEGIGVLNNGGFGSRCTTPQILDTE